MMQKIAQLKETHDALIEELSTLELEKAEATARNQTATKAEKVETAKEAARLRSAVSMKKKEISAAERALAKAEKDVEKARAKAEKNAEEQAKKEAAIAAQQQRSEYVEQRKEQAKSNPLLDVEVNYSLLGEWIAEKAQGAACYVEGAGWGEWTGTHWQFSTKPSPQLQDRVRNLYKNETGEVAQKLNANAMSAKYILEHAQAALTVPRERFNRPAVAHLVAFQNVTVNLKNGETMPNNSEHYMTGALQCDYDEKADARRIDETFARFWPEDTDTAFMFKTAVGYSMTGETAAKRSFFMVGDQEDSNSNGDNGKSLVQNALMQLTGVAKGGWGTSVKPGLIIDTGDRDANSHDGAKTPLIWKRFAMSSEPRKGAAIESGEFNRLTGGDTQTARPPHAEESVQFVNFATFWISLNNMIRFKTFDRATRQRLTPFPFTESFYDPGTAPEGCQVKELGLKEWLEGPEGQKALARYVVEGAIAYYACNGGKAGNFPDSDRVARERDNLLAAANPFADMFEDMFEFDPNADTPESTLNALLRLECGGPPKEWQKSTFYDAMKGRGVVAKKLNGNRFRRGVGLSEKGRNTVKAFISSDKRKLDMRRSSENVVAMS